MSSSRTPSSASISVRRATTRLVSLLTGSLVVARLVTKDIATLCLLFVEFQTNHLQSFHNHRESPYKTLC